MNRYLATDICGDEDDEIKAMTKVNVTRVNNHIYFYDEINDESHRIFQQLFEEAKQYVCASNGATMFEKGRLEEGVVVHINSPGGLVSDSLAMYDFLKEQDFPSVGIIEGMAASGATLLLCGCTMRLMTKHSFALIHELRSGTYGKFSHLKDDSVNNNFLMKTIKEVYLAETKLTEDEIDEVLSHDIYWGLEDCKKYGLVQGAIGEEVSPEEEDIKEAIKEKEDELKQLKDMLPKKKSILKPRPAKPAVKKPAPKEKKAKEENK